MRKTSAHYILQAVGRAAGEIAVDWRRGAPKLLARIGSATGVSHAYLLQRERPSEGGSRARQVQHWSAPEVAGEPGGPAALDFLLEERETDPVVDALESGEAVAGITRERPRSERRFLESRGILSFLYVPIAVGGEWSGCIACGDCSGERSWSATEIDGLQAAARLLGSALERERAEQELARSESRYRGLFENVPVGLYQSTATGELRAANPALVRLLGYDSEDEMRGLDIARDLYADPQARRQWSERLEAEEELGAQELVLRRRDGSHVTVLDSARCVGSGADGEVLFEGTLLDISLRKRYEARLERQALYDELTGLPNRRLVSDRLELGLRQARRRGLAVAVVFLDLDGFKQVNDSLGHSAGDHLLLQVADRLRSGLREGDTLARFGGDEFVFVLPDLPGPEVANGVCDRVQAILARPIEVMDHPFRMACSMGVALSPGDGRDAETLLRKADAAMYRAKGRGGGRYVYFDPSRDRQSSQRLRRERELRQALAAGELTLHYQPIWDTGSGELVAAEALLRWPRRTGPPVPPSELVALAEDCGLIVELGDWVLENACREAASWSLPLRVAVNVSPGQVTSGDLAASVSRALETSGLARERLEIEITERLLLRVDDDTRRALEAVGALGVRLSFDDFGVGSSSLESLRRLPFQVLKIDRSFLVEHAGRDPRVAALVGAMVAMGHGLGLEVVAEGVESGEDLEFLRERRCDLVQGFYLARPMPAGELQELFGRVHEQQPLVALPTRR